MHTMKIIIAFAEIWTADLSHLNAMWRPLDHGAPSKQLVLTHVYSGTGLV